MPSCTGGAAHFAGKLIGVGDGGLIKLEAFLYCNELPGVSVPEIKSEHSGSTYFKQNSSRSYVSSAANLMVRSVCLPRRVVAKMTRFVAQAIMASLAGLPAA
jgi:hypothetical protein